MEPAAENAEWRVVANFVVFVFVLEFLVRGVVGLRENDRLVMAIWFVAAAVLLGVGVLVDRKIRGFDARASAQDGGN
ncbi:MAG TPA: hypothetical protein VGB18_06515 [Candidatus Thermoplasmatota archaeon]